jgi:hypothetical protein
LADAPRGLRGSRGLRLVLGVLACTAGLLAVGCSAGGSGSSGGGTVGGSTPGSADGSPSVAASGPGAGGSPGATTQPVVSAETPLAVAADINLGASYSSPGDVVSTEAPDGAVFYVSGAVIYVVDGNNPAAVALHPKATVLAMTADSATLYVVTPTALVAYSRASGARTGRWPLTASPAPVTSAGAVSSDGTVWVWTCFATDESGLENATLYVIPAGAAKASVVSEVMSLGTLAADGPDAFFVNATDDGRSSAMFEWEPSAASPPGVSRQGAASQLLGTPAVADGRMLLLSGTKLAEFAPAAGRGPAAGRAVTVPDLEAIATTAAGLLGLGCQSQTACSVVERIDPASGAVQSRLDVPGAGVPDPGHGLLGPDPALLTVESGQLHLVRLS